MDNKKQHISLPSDVQAPNPTPKAMQSMNAVSNNSISQNSELSIDSGENSDVRFSKGQNAKVSANNTGSRVYSKKLAKAAIDVITESNLVFGGEYSTLKGTIKGKGAIIDELFYKLNRTQNKDYQRAVANDIAKQIVHPNKFMQSAS